MWHAPLDSMGNSEADHASPMGAPANVMTGHQAPQGWGPTPGSGDTAAAAMPEERARQNTPLWMETSTVRPQARRGVSPAPRSSLHTLLFFGLIVFVVGAAGIGGVALWGPEKPIKNRTQFATNPPPPATLPSLPPSATLAAPAAIAPVAEAAPAPSESARPAEAPPAKKTKKSPKAWKKR